MKIDGDDDCWFALEPLETDPMGRRDVHASVSFAGRGFTAANPSVWFDGDAIASFITALRQLDADRDGNATLHTMSPDECVLNFRDSDGLGHLMLDVWGATINLQPELLIRSNVVPCNRQTDGSRTGNLAAHNMVFTQGRGFVFGASFGLLCRSLRQRVLVCHAADTASLATCVLFGKLIGVATLFGFGEKRCRKNLPLSDPRCDIAQSFSLRSRS